LLELAAYGAQTGSDQPARDVLAGVATNLRQMAEDIATHRRARSAPELARQAQGRAVTDGARQLSFARDIRPLFREKDTQSMSWAFDLGKYEDVKAHAEAIYRRLAGGTMPCDGAWAPESVAMFKQWMNDGSPA
jgi:hypothetical protein